MSSPVLRGLAGCLALATATAGTASGEWPADPVPLTRALTSVETQPAQGELRAQFVDIRLDALGGDDRSSGSADGDPLFVWIDLFAEEILILERSLRRPLARGGYAWIGRPVDGDLGHAFFVVRNGKVYGSVRRPGLNLQIRPDGVGGHRMAVQDDDLWPEESDDSVPVWSLPATAESPSPEQPLVGNPTIDVLVVYSEAARLAAGGREALEALIDLVEVETNTSYAARGVNQRIRVVHTAEVVYTETGNALTDLARLSTISDGFLDEVHALRDTYGADVVSLWLENTGCGLGYLMTTVSSAFEAYAFNVCRRSCATGNLTFAHELGHNMSLRHDWFVDQGTSPFTYNHGFVDIDANLGSSFRTVMAYGNRCRSVFGSSCTRLTYFSNPSVSVGGEAAGIASGTSAACIEGVHPTTECDADNATALNNAAATLAAFRPTQFLAQITKEVDSGFVDIDDTITYTLTVTNGSNLTANDIEIEDVVPVHTSLQTGSLSADAAATGTAAGSTITWNVATSLAPGQSLVRSFSVTALEGGVVTNSATVTSSNSSIDSKQSSNTVATSIGEAVSCGFQDGFESGTFSHYWRVETTQDGRARVLPELPDSGTYSAILDDTVPDATTSEAALLLAANLAGESRAQLNFRWAEAGDENGALDGVYIREAKSDAWVKVLDFVDTTDLVFHDGSVDLVQAAADNGLTLTDGFQIRLQFSDNSHFNPGDLGDSDGYAIDNVSLDCSCTTELADVVVSGPTPVVEQSSCTLYAGPSYTVEPGGDLTLHSEQGVVLRDGFVVMEGAQLAVIVG